MQSSSYLRHCILHDLLVLHIALVTDQQLVDTLGCVTVDFLKPLLNVVERVHVGHIVDNADAVGATVVGGSDRAEALLTSGIPLEYIVRLCQFGPQREGLQVVCIRSEASRSCPQVR